MDFVVAPQNHVGGQRRKKIFIKEEEARGSSSISTLATGWEKKWGGIPWINHRLEMIALIRIFLKVNIGSKELQRDLEIGNDFP